MGHLPFKLIPLFLFYFISINQQVNSQVAVGKVYSLTPNDPKETPFEVGKSVQCTVRSQKQKAACNDIQVSLPTINAYDYKTFYPLAKDQKCFSFQLRGTSIPHMLFSSQPSANQSNSVELLFRQGGDTSLIRINYYTLIAAQYKSADIINNNELRGFWMKWVDNLIQVGRNTESTPFLEYKFTGIIPANYVSLLAYAQPAEWIIHGEPKCGPYEIKQSQLEAVCDYQTTQTGKK